METQRWHQVDELLAAVLDRAPQDRAAFLAEACAGDGDLRREVEALLAADEKSRGILDDPEAVARTASPRPAAAGEEIGPYRIERELGRGGMGTVYLASRADEAFERSVAVKLLNPGLLSPELERRFRSERQILASLEHPGIARLYEGGATADGRPYLVMEYVDGEPVDEYCDRRRLSVRQRVELFREICDAVHFAHQNLVVHRDIKPSNILVTASAEPRLVDFGIAKPLDPAFPVTVAATRLGVRAMTPQYASPEQVRGEAVTTATDVYSLGALLYELLTGQLPHRLERLSAGEIERVLTDELPARPSDAVTGWRKPAAKPPSGRAARRLAEAPLADAVSRDRGARPGQLRRQLAGDLDNIVLMALRKEPERRYGSVRELSEDLRRYLEGRPVAARQDSFGYHLRRFLRRHWLGVAAVGLILALVLGSAAATAYQAAEVARQRDRAESERRHAERVSDFLVDLFRGHDPWRLGSDKVTVRELVDGAAARLGEDLDEAPEVRARLLDTVSGVYSDLGAFDRAIPLIEDMVKILRDLHGSEHPQVGHAMMRLAFVYRQSGRTADAAELAEQAYEILQRFPDLEDAATAKSLRMLGNIYGSLGDFEKTDEVSLRALEMVRRTVGSEDAEAAAVLGDLGRSAAEQGDLEGAMAYLEEAQAINRKLYGEVHQATASGLFIMAAVRIHHGEHAAAEPQLRRALEIYEEVFEEDHPMIASVLAHQAMVWRRQGRPEEARNNLERAIGLLEGTLGREHYVVGRHLRNLGATYMDLGSLDEAEPRLERSLAICEQAFGPTHGEVGESLLALARLRAAQGREADAKRLFGRALAVWEERPENEALRPVPEAYAAFLRAVGRVEEAAGVEARAAAVYADSGEVSSSRR